VLGVLAVLDALAHRGADLPHERQVDRERLVQALENGDSLLTLDDLPDEIAGERAKHEHVHHAHLETPSLPQVVHHRFGRGDHASLTHDEVVRVVGPVRHHSVVATTGERVELLEGLLGQSLDMIEEKRPLSRHALHVRVLVLDQTGHQRVVHVPQQRDAPAGFAVDDLLRRGRGVDDVIGSPQVLGDELTFRHQHRLDEVGGQETVLGNDPGSECKLGDPMGDDVQIRRSLSVLGEHLEEANIVDAVVVVMSRVHVEGGLGHGSCADIQDVSQPLAHRCIERLVHVGDTLAGREVRRTHARHGHACRHRRRGVLAFGLDEDQRTPGDVDVSSRSGLGPVFAHLSRGRDRVGPGRIARFALAHDDGAVAVQCGPGTGVFEVASPLFPVALVLFTEA